MVDQSSPVTDVQQAVPVAQGYAEAEAMLRDLILPSQISGTAIRVARDHMMQFVRFSYPWKPVEGLEGVEDARKYIASRCDAADQSGARSITFNTAVLRLAFPEPDATQTREAEAIALVREMADPDLQDVSISLHRTWQKQALRIAALNARDAA